MEWARLRFWLYFTTLALLSTLSSPTSRGAQSDGGGDRKAPGRPVQCHLTHTGVCLTVYFEIVEGQRVGRSWRTGASSTAFWPSWSAR